jgi:hypothetical protein
MKSLRLLLVLFSLASGALPGASAASAPFRLFELGITRFVRDADGQGHVESGRLNALGTFTRVSTTPSAFVDFVPAELLGKNLIYTEGWFAYGQLGDDARANFQLADGGQPLSIRGLVYYRVETHEAARLAVAEVVNLSTRGRITPGTTPTLIGGFVVEGRHGVSRRVLVRAIGPSLAQFGVADAASDTFLFIEKNGQTLHFNGNWGERFDADEIASVTTQVGAFPLARASKDAALIVELPPGAYTASVVTEGGSTGGTALLEVYVLP